MLINLSCSSGSDGEMQVSGLPEGFFLAGLDEDISGGFDIRLAMGEYADANLFIGAFKRRETQARLSLGGRMIDGQVTSLRRGYGLYGDYVMLHVVEI